MCTDALPSGQIVSLQVGLPRKMMTSEGKVWESAIVKTPVQGRVALGPESFTGDCQANRKHHGGPDKAVCVYSVEHYPLWNEMFSLRLVCGAFGENLTTEGLTEERICIGDVLSVGTARLQVSQPRMPCANISRRWERKDLPLRMEETGFTGFYCRVLQPGEIEAGDTVKVTERIYPDWTLLRANRTLYHEGIPADDIAVLQDLPLLTGEWKRALARKLQKGR